MDTSIPKMQQASVNPQAGMPQRANANLSSSVRRQPDANQNASMQQEGRSSIVTPTLTTSTQPISLEIIPTAIPIPPIIIVTKDTADYIKITDEERDMIYKQMLRLKKEGKILDCDIKDPHICQIISER
jgi:hypothetical protein